MPFITSQINEANDLSEDVAGRLPDLKEDIAEADREYTRGRQKAVRLENQLQWLAAQWHVKLWRIMRGQVKGRRRTLFLRVVAPLAIICAGVGALALVIWWFVSLWD